MTALRAVTGLAGRRCCLLRRAVIGALPLVLLAAPALAISERTFAVDYAERVVPYYDNGVGGRFAGSGGVSIAYRLFDRGPATPAIVLLPGYSEPARKYAELIYDLGARGYSIYIMDHRGQGASDRLTPLHDLGHIDDFSYLVADFETFMASVVLPGGHPRLYLLAHSMGAAVGTLYLANHPTVFRAAVFSSPMFRIDTHDTSELYAYLGSLWKVWTGAGQEPVDGPQRYRFDPSRTVAESNVTSSGARWQEHLQIIRDDPRLALGGVSYGWLNQAMRATRGIDRLGARLRIPVVVLKAGRDTIVHTEADDSFCRRSPAPCTVASAPFADARHEILQERDAIRDEAIAIVLATFP